MPARLIALFPLVAVSTLIALVARRAILVTLVALSTALLLGRTLALALLGRTLEAPQLLPKGLDVARIGSALAVRFFDEFKHFVHLFEGFPQRHDDFHHFVDGFTNQVRRSGLKGALLTEGGWRRNVARRGAFLMTFLTHLMFRTRRRRGRLADFGNRTRRLVRDFHFRRRSKVGFVSTLNGFSPDLLSGVIRRLRI